MITPEIAKDYLSKSRGNRNISSAKVIQYARDMQVGRWQTTHQGIAFDSDGVLKDGHHRLHAVIKAGCSVEMPVIENVLPEATVFDRGRSRDTRQFLKYNELLPAHLTDNTAIAIANLHFYMRDFGYFKRKTDFDIKDFLVDNQNTMLATMQVLSQTKEKARSGIKNAAFGYALFCAIKCDVSVDLLLRFTYVAATGFSNGPEEYAAVVIRNQLLANKGVSTMSVKRELCQNGMAAIKDFSEGKTRKNPYYAKGAYYLDLWKANQEGM